jgi:hypothetical protein
MTEFAMAVTSTGMLCTCGALYLDDTWSPDDKIWYGHIRQSVQLHPLVLRRLRAEIIAVFFA